VLDSCGSAFLAQVRESRPPAEQRAGPQGEFRVDVVLAPGIILDLDGYAWHSTPEHKQHDDAPAKLAAQKAIRSLSPRGATCGTTRRSWRTNSLGSSSNALVATR
jgi:hypothetical protein